MASSSSQSSLPPPPPPQDCTPCKIIGAGGFGGLGAYSFYQRAQIPKNLAARRAGMAVLGSVFIGAAVYRLLMPVSSGAQQEDVQSPHSSPSST
ncbi:hypothetical protein DFQ27_009770 [Actinomortierella ambigua]|uniref:Distal membrane-arm assembly complex protein 1-like domain-containing protein n=1 Tax=Actinomortierella ambigua TaxID=1343610 RepID=A0A9P6TWL6_9FUNG|nr:hypothetical protein DFQ27_009770 [Actinomortierella ambigua]